MPYKPQPCRAVNKLVPYTPGLFAGRIKLDSNENPYPFPAAAAEKIFRVSACSFHRYPDPLASKLRRAVSRMHRIGPDMVVPGNGSDELIYYLISVFCGDGKSVISPAPGFDMYNIIARGLGIKAVSSSLDSSFDIDEKDIIRKAAEEKAGIIFLAYPNNPTGNCFSERKIQAVIEKCGCLVVIDEAYADFSGKSFIGKLKKYPNLAVLRTFSKAYAMAGLRTGYLASSAEICAAVDKVRLPYNLNSFSQEAAVIAVSMKKEFKKQWRLIIKERNKLYEAAAGNAGAVKSSANFVLVSFNNPDRAEKIFRKNKTAVRFFRQGRLRGFARITAGTPAENAAVIRILKRGV